MGRAAAVAPEHRGTTLLADSLAALMLGAAPTRMTATAVAAASDLRITVTAGTPATSRAESTERNIVNTQTGEPRVMTRTGTMRSQQPLIMIQQNGRKRNIPSTLNCILLPIMIG